MAGRAMHRGTTVRARAVANDRLKGRWGSLVWVATVLGAVAHVAALLAGPEMRVELQAPPPGPSSGELLQLIRIGAVVDHGVVPSASNIPVPALPTVDLKDLDIELDAPIEVPDFSAFEDLEVEVTPPIRTEQDEWLDYKAFAPYIVRPEIRNREELKRFLETQYQRIFEYSGATGVVQVAFWIDESGMVEKAEILKSSGVRSLDRLALRLSRVLRFRPAMMAGRPVRILVHVPITFRAA